MIAQRPPQPWTFKLFAAALGIVIGLSLAWVETVTDAGTHQVHVAAVGFGHSNTISASRTEVAERRTDAEYATSDRESDSVTSIRRTTFSHRLGGGAVGALYCSRCTSGPVSGNGPRVFVPTAGEAAAAASREGGLSGSKTAAKATHERTGHGGRRSGSGQSRRR